MESVALVCPHCGRSRATGSECPFCGVIYAKALAIEAPPAVVWQGAADDARLERRLRAVAIPAALLFMWLAVQAGFTHMLVRTVLTMWLHESGHAVTALLCGFAAFPLPWKTPVAESRSIFVALAVAAGLIGVVVTGLRRQQPLVVGVGVLLLVAQVVGTLLIRPDTARMLITFGGDAGAMIFGTLLMASVYARRGSSIRTGALRWGFLVIGAGAFVDTFSGWWSAWGNIDRVPFGANEGSGPSDPSVLFDTCNWTMNNLLSRYIGLGVACLACLAALYVIGLVREDR